MHYQCVNILVKCVNILAKWVNILAKCVNILAKHVNILAKCVNILAKCVNNQTGITYNYHIQPVVGIAQSVLLVAMGWKVWGSNPGGGEIFRTCPDWPWGPSSLLYNGYRVSFLRLKRPGRGIDHPPPSSAEVKERVELYLYSLSWPSWPVIGWTVPVPFNHLWPSIDISTSVGFPKTQPSSLSVYPQVPLYLYQFLYSPHFNTPLHLDWSFHLHFQR
jgi:hypothetical protein